MRRLQLALALALVALVAGAMPVAAGGPPASRDAKASTKVYDKTSAIVVFKSQPLATYDGHLKGYERTKPAPGKKLNPNSAASKKYAGLPEDPAQRVRVLAAQERARREDHVEPVLDAERRRREAERPFADEAALEHVRLGRRVHDPLPEDDERVAQAHQRRPGVGQSRRRPGRRGRGIKIGIIDSGVDYRHPFFDPTGFATRRASRSATHATRRPTAPASTSARRSSSPRSSTTSSTRTATTRCRSPTSAAMARTSRAPLPA